MARKPSRSREIAEKIGAHLFRFEHDPKINVRNRYVPETRKWVPDPNAIPLYYLARAWATGNCRVSVIYITFQHASVLTMAEAEAYLAWLDAGNVGRHYKMQGEARGVVAG